jgi:hypothetical protein
MGKEKSGEKESWSGKRAFTKSGSSKNEGMRMCIE